MAFVRYYVGDVVKMKKSHPCGSAEWEVKRIGTDFTIVCRGCGHQVMLSRSKFEKAVKKNCDYVQLKRRRPRQLKKKRLLRQKWRHKQM
mgnify:CR=1 FL=1